MWICTINASTVHVAPPFDSSVLVPQLLFETLSQRWSFHLQVSGVTLPLPPKKVFGNMDNAFIAERQQGLQVENKIIYNANKNCL